MKLTVKTVPPETAEVSRARNNRHLKWACDCAAFRAPASARIQYGPCMGCGQPPTRRERTLAEIQMGVTLDEIRAPGYVSVTYNNAACESFIRSATADMGGDDAGLVAALIRSYDAFTKAATRAGRGER